MKSKQKDSESVPLVYFFGGAIIPRYANLTLRHARSHWRGEIIVLHSHFVPRKISGITYVNYTEWYDSSVFQQYRTGSPLDEEFRQGFWYLTAERFFVLAQWVEAAGIQRFLHAELDVALFDVSDLPTRLDAIGDGIFYPRASREFAGASCFYVNSVAALGDFLTFAGNNASLGSEMRVLAKFNDVHPDKALALPSHSSIELDWGSGISWRGLEPADVGGIIDVGAIGTWVLGNDPRNIGKALHLNKAIVEGHGNTAFEQLRFCYSLTQKSLWVQAKGSDPVRIRALHIHSKAMRAALSPVGLVLVTWLLRLPWRTVLGSQNLHLDLLRRMRGAIDFFYGSCRNRRYVRSQTQSLKGR